MDVTTSDSYRIDVVIDGGVPASSPLMVTITAGVVSIADTIVAGSAIEVGYGIIERFSKFLLWLFNSYQTGWCSR